MRTRRKSPGHRGYLFVKDFNSFALKYISGALDPMKFVKSEKSLNVRISSFYLFSPTKKRHYFHVTHYFVVLLNISFLQEELFSEFFKYFSITSS
jgi:hypothetical protein